MKRSLLFGALALIFVFALAACGEDAAPETVIKTVIETVEVPGETIIVEKVVVETVEVPGETIIREVVRTVEVPGETIIVEVPGETITVEVPGEVVIKEVIRIVEKIIEVPVAATVSYSEAPLFTQLVQAGKLPRVEDRLPKQPMLIPALEIGRYGGTIRRVYLGRADQWNYGRISREGLVRWSTDASTQIPAVARGWESSADGKVWTFFLREGMRWSDGAPFTADDFAFMFDDLIMNDEISPTKPGRLKVKGELGTIAKVDDYTVRFEFPFSNFVFPAVVSQMDSTTCCNNTYMPKHYLKQFHLEFNPNAEKLAKDAGFDTWAMYFLNRMDWRDNPERPQVRPWVPVPGNNFGSSSLFTATRNPYFYAVDQVGNQLPYIDRLQFTLVQDNDILQLKAIAGEIDFQGRHVNLAMFPLLKEHEEKGGYHMTIWPALTGAEIGLFFNQDWEGPEAQYFQDRDFRIALSHAIERNEINEISYLGQGTPRQPAPAPSEPHYPGDELAFRWTEFDPALANQILDGIGLDIKDSDGFRLMANGDRLHIIMDTTPGEGRDTDTMELIARNWQDVGISVKVNEMTRTLLYDRFQGSQHMLTVWGYGMGDPSLSEADAWMDRSHPLQRIWYQSDGANGIAPDPIVKQITDLRAETPTLPRDESVAVARELVTLQLEQLYVIGVTGLSPSNQGVVITSNRLANVPDIAANAWPYRTPSPAFPEQFFFKQ